MSTREVKKGMPQPGVSFFHAETKGREVLMHEISTE